MQFAEYSVGTVPQTSRLRYRVFNTLYHPVIVVTSITSYDLLLKTLALRSK
jgi:hypothetical protein